MDKKGIGARGEQIAADFLKRNGYDIVTRNFRTRYGEIDIVAKEKDTLVFVEVRSKSSHFFGTPEESVTRGKQNKLRLMAEYFLLNKRLSGRDYRIDLIAILFEAGKAKLKHLRSIC